MTINKLPEEHVNALLRICYGTTFLGQEMPLLATSHIDSIECKIRSATYREIKKHLNILEKAGYIAVHTKGNIKGFFVRKSIVSVNIKLLDRDNYCELYAATQNSSR